MITSYDQVRAEGNLPEDFEDDRLLPHIQTAERRLRKLITDAVYNAVFDVEDPGFDLEGQEDLDDDGRKRFFLQKAEALLACHFGAPVWNQTTAGGGYRASGGFGESRWENMSQDEIEQMAARYLELAMEYITPYLPADDETDEEDDDIGSAGTLNFGVV